MNTLSRVRSRMLLGVLLTVLSAAATHATPPTVWISPPPAGHGHALRDMLDHPDSWKSARAGTDVLFYADHNLDSQFTDSELKSWFREMARWKMPLALEVGAVKEWGVTGAKTFQVEQPMWDRFTRLGAPIYAVAMDEPLTCVRQRLGQTDDYAVRETANFIALVRQHDPHTLVGDIEPYPYLSLADHEKWVAALQQRLADIHVRGLDFYRLDVDWTNFVVGSHGSWLDVKALEQFCRQASVPFGLIYWAADYPALEQKGLADDATWYVSVMQQGYDYLLVNGAPDQYVIESWVDGPRQSIPDSAEWTFTRSVRDFVQRFVRPGQHSH